MSLEHLHLIHVYQQMPQALLQHSSKNEVAARSRSIILFKGCCRWFRKASLEMRLKNNSKVFTFCFLAISSCRLPEVITTICNCFLPNMQHCWQWWTCWRGLGIDVHLCPPSKDQRPSWSTCNSLAQWWPWNNNGLHSMNPITLLMPNGNWTEIVLILFTHGQNFWHWME
jgi:hypothetical protein